MTHNATTPASENDAILIDAIIIGPYRFNMASLGFSNRVPIPILENMNIDKWDGRFEQM
jgi:hypothetical protein